MEDMYGLTALPIVLIIIAVVNLYEILWKERNDRKLIRKFKKEISSYGENADETLQKILRDYARDSMTRYNKRLHEKIEADMKKLKSGG